MVVLSFDSKALFVAPWDVIPQVVRQRGRAKPHLLSPFDYLMFQVLARFDHRGASIAGCHPVTRAMAERGVGDGGPLPPCRPFHQKHRVAGAVVQMRHLQFGGGGGQKTDLDLGKGDGGDKPFVRALPGEILIARLWQGGKVDPAVFELIGRAVGLVQADQVQDLRAGFKVQLGAQGVGGGCDFAAEKRIAVGGPERFNLGTDQRDFKARLPDRGHADTGAGFAAPVDQAKVGDFAQGPVYRRAGTGEVAGEVGFGRKQGSRPPRAVGDAAQDFGLDGAE